MVVHCREEGYIGKYIPEDREVSLGWDFGSEVQSSPTPSIYSTKVRHPPHYLTQHFIQIRGQGPNRKTLLLGFEPKLQQLVLGTLWLLQTVWMVKQDKPILNPGLFWPDDRRLTSLGLPVPWSGWPAGRKPLLWLLR